MKPKAALFALAWVCWSATAFANPDVWVQSKITYLIDRETVTGIEFEWWFDQYFSSKTIDEFDVDKNNQLDSKEIETLRAAAFDPLKKHNYYIYAWADGEDRAVEVKTFSARIVENILVYEISIQIKPAVDYQTQTLSTSLHDKKTFIDFQFAEGQFLLVKGEFNQACKFRVSRGSGPQAGHPKVITLLCGA
jgi:ABC-type uncharacterized transport system substrate-binding protein